LTIAFAAPVSSWDSAFNRADGGRAQLVVIDDKNGIDTCKVLGIAFTTAVGILIRSREKGLLEGPDAIGKLALLAKHGPTNIQLSRMQD
jgi:predicted nucleic acid-binding protein